MIGIEPELVNKLTYLMETEPKLENVIPEVKKIYEIVAELHANLVKENVENPVVSIDDIVKKAKKELNLSEKHIEFHLNSLSFCYEKLKCSRMGDKFFYRPIN